MRERARAREREKGQKKVKEIMAEKFSNLKRHIPKYGKSKKYQIGLI